MKLKNYDYNKMIDIQKFFNKKLFRDKGIDIDCLENNQFHSIIKDYCLHLIDEVLELLRELNWKMHIPWNKELNREKIIEEIVDIDKFQKNILMILNITEEEFIDMWNKKTQKVLDKYEKKN